MIEKTGYSTRRGGDRFGLRRIFCVSFSIFLVTGLVLRVHAADLAIRFLSPADKARVEVEETPGSFYKCFAELEVSGNICQKVVLEADGLKMFMFISDDKEPYLKTSLPWWPWHGEGSYRLKAYAQKLHTQEFQARAEISVEVTGIPRNVITPENHLIKLLRERSGHADLFAAPCTRFTSPDAKESRWFSTIWVGKHMYCAILYDDGREEVQQYPVNFDPGNYSVYMQPVTRPAGTYRMLVVMLDYGSWTVTREEALAALGKAAADANRRWADYAQQLGMKGAFFKLNVTGAFAKASFEPDSLTFPVQKIKALTGFDPGEFDLYAQVDLSKTPPPGLKKPAGGWSLTSYKGRGADTANFWILIQGPEYLYTHLCWTLLDHELAHSFGWQHEWPVGMGSGPENTEYKSVWPALLLGWTDRDGDGVIEILDPTPYGIRF